jgi:hypothetical protein
MGGGLARTDEQDSFILSKLKDVCADEQAVTVAPHAPRDERGGGYHIDRRMENLVSVLTKKRHGARIPHEV